MILIMIKKKYRAITHVISSRRFPSFTTYPSIVILKVLSGLITVKKKKKKKKKKKGIFSKTFFLMLLQIIDKKRKIKKLPLFPVGAAI